MNKIISYLAIVVLSVAGFSAAAKEASTAQQNTLANVEVKAVELAASIEKVQKQLIELDAQKNERMKVEIERDRKGIEFWFAALAIMTTIVAALGALFPYLMARKDKELLKVELDGVKNDRAEIQRMKAEVQNTLNDAKADSAVVKDYKEEVALLMKLQPDDKSTEVEKEKVIQAANQVIKSSENPEDSERAYAIKASQQRDFELALLLWKRFLDKNRKDAQASFYLAYCLQQISKKKLHPTTDDFANIQKAYSVAEKNDILKNGELVNFWILNNWGVALDDEATQVAKSDLQAAQKLWKQSREKYAKVIATDPDNITVLNNFGLTLGKEAQVFQKTDIEEAKKMWRQAGEKFSRILNKNPEDVEAVNHLATTLINEGVAMQKTSENKANALMLEAESLLKKYASKFPDKVAYNLACVYSLLGKDSESVEQLELARRNDKLPSHWLTEDDLTNLREADEYKTWYKTHFGEDKT